MGLGRWDPTNYLLLYFLSREFLLSHLPHVIICKFSREKGKKTIKRNKEEGRSDQRCSCLLDLKRQKIKRKKKRDTQPTNTRKKSPSMHSTLPSFIHSFIHSHEKEKEKRRERCDGVKARSFWQFQQTNSRLPIFSSSPSPPAFMRPKKDLSSFISLHLSWLSVYLEWVACFSRERNKLFGAL